MPQTPSTCVTCGSPFALNRDLAAIPDASKIAFDPRHSRVWRVCAGCGEWNLLGVEAATAALPEIEARYLAAMPGGARAPGLAAVRLSSRLEFLRVAKEDLIGEGDSVAVRLRQEIDRRARMMRRAAIVGGIGLVLWLGYVVWVSNGDPNVPLLMLLGFSEVGLLQRLAARIRGERVKRVPFLINLGILFAAAGLVVWFMGWNHLRFSLSGMLTVFPIMLVAEPFFRSKVWVARLRLSDGTLLKFSVAAARKVTLSWSVGGTGLAMHDFPGGVSIAGRDVSLVYPRVYGWAIDSSQVQVRAIATINESAYALLGSVGGLSGLLCALEGFRRDSDGRVLLAELPILYLAALDLSLTAEAGGPAAHDALRARALEAAEVAKHAEALDAGWQGGQTKVPGGR